MSLIFLYILCIGPAGRMIFHELFDENKEYQDSQKEIEWEASCAKAILMSLVWPISLAILLTRKK